MALQAAADELYALPPEQFTAARDDFVSRLRRAGERELATAVRELRRPSVPAWLVNVLVRRRGQGLDELLEIGEQLRSAMSTGAGDEVRRLTDHRRTAVAALTADLAALAGRPVPASAAEDVRLTLEAATADPAAAAAVRSGRLVRPLRYAGFGELPDLVGAVGLAPTPTAPAKQDSRPNSAAPARPAERNQAERNQAERNQAERAVHEAAGAADDTQRAYEQRLVERADAAAKVTAAADAVTAAAEQLRDAQDQLAQAREAEKNAAAAATAARKVARAAHATADVARRRLALLRSAPEANRRQ